MGKAETIGKERVIELLNEHNYIRFRFRKKTGEIRELNGKRGMQI